MRNFYGSEIPSELEKDISGSSRNPETAVLGLSVDHSEYRGQGLANIVAGAADSALPSLVTHQNCSVRTPAGPKVMANPLYRYHLPPPARHDIRGRLNGTNSIRLLEYTVRRPEASNVNRSAVINEGLQAAK